MYGLPEDQILIEETDCIDLANDLQAIVFPTHLYIMYLSADNGIILILDLQFKFDRLK